MHTGFAMSDFSETSGESVEDNWIMALLFAGGKKQKYNEPIAGRTRLMKLLFLLGQRLPKGEPYFQFEPYKFGPHSSEVLRRLDRLVATGFVQTEPGFGSDIYGLTPKGVDRSSPFFNSLNPRLRQKIVDVKIQFNAMPLRDLLALVYERFPSFASQSEYEGPPEE